MFEKILAKLKEKFPGVPDETLNRIAKNKANGVTDEAQIEGIVEGVNFQSIIQSETDARISEANRRAIENYEAKHGIKDGKPVKPVEPLKQEPSDMPAWFKAYKEENDKLITGLKTTIEQSQAKQTREQLIAKVTEKVTGLKVPASFLKGRVIDIDSPEKIDEVATSIKSDYDVFRQDMVNAGVVFDKPRESTGEPTDADMENYMKDKFGEKEK